MRHDRLHELHQKRLIRKKQLLEEQGRKQQDDEMSECTFHPSLVMPPVEEREAQLESTMR